PVPLLEQAQHAQLRASVLRPCHEREALLVEPRCTAAQLADQSDPQPLLRGAEQRVTEPGARGPGLALDVRGLEWILHHLALAAAVASEHPRAPRQGRPIL